MGVDEPGLVARARAGDEDAFRGLVERHQERVYRTAYAVVGDHADAAEVAQETWIKAWRALGGFRGDAAVGTWLTRLAVNAARDHVRRRRVRAAADGLFQERLARPAGAVEAVEERDALGCALDALSAGQRRLVALRHVLDMTVNEIARLLGVPPGTVKSRLHAAGAALRSALRESDGDGHSRQEQGSDAGHLPGAPPARRPGARPGGAGRSELGQPGRPTRATARLRSDSPAPRAGSPESEHGPGRDESPRTRSGLGRRTLTCRSRPRTVSRSTPERRRHAPGPSAAALGRR
jgi:RNA polymerase sigma-70 factor (ECF subfamily)